MKVFFYTLLMLAAGLAPAAEVGKEGLLINLKPYYTRHFDEPGFKGVGKELPAMNPMFDGLRFKLTGQLSLWSSSRVGRGEIHPVEVRDIPVVAKFDELHLVHHGNFSDVEGRPIAHVQLNYENGSKHSYPIIWGYHVWSWCFFPGEETMELGDPNAKFIWLDPAKDNTRFKGWRMLWKTHFMNPHPDRLVRSIDFISTGAYGTYSVVSAVAAKTDTQRTVSPSVDLGIPPRDFKGRVKIKVTSAATGQPIPNATIRTSTKTKGIHVVARSVATDENGEAVFRYWKEETSLVVLQAHAPGHVSGYHALDGDIAPSVSIALSAAMSVGGIVVDDTGKPLPHITVKIGSSVTYTDSDGRWELDGQESRHLDRYPVTLVRYRDPKRELNVGKKDLLAKKATLVFEPGGELTGIVRDEKGKPIPNARVYFRKAYYDKTSPVVRTDKQGRFEFSNLPRGENYLTVRNWTQAPAIIRLDIGAKNEPLIIDTKPGLGFLFFVRDAKGKGIPGVVMRGIPSQGPPTYSIQLKTKKDGSLFFGGLPDHPFRVTFSKPGFRTRRESFKPSNTQPYTVVLDTAP